MYILYTKASHQCCVKQQENSLDSDSNNQPQSEWLNVIRIISYTWAYHPCLCVGRLQTEHRWDPGVPLGTLLQTWALPGPDLCDGTER